MKHLAKTFPVLFVSMGYAQMPVDTEGEKIDFGFTTSTFAGASVNYFANTFLDKQNLYSYLLHNISPIADWLGPLFLTTIVYVIGPPGT